MNTFRFINVTFLLALSLFTGACAQMNKIDGAKLLPDQGPVRLSFKPSLGGGDISDYHSFTTTKAFEKNEIIRKVSETFDFTVQTKVAKVDSTNAAATYELTTLKKDGKGDLSDYAMPEVGESLELVLANDGQVLKAGEFPPGTLYFVPPTSLPKGAVKVGDTWPMEAEWVSLKSGVPIHMSIVSIFKAIRDCGPAGLCAEIEISGDENIIGAPSNPIASKVPAKSDDKKTEDVKMRFTSQTHGRMLFSIDKGTILYSYMRSDEHMTGEKDSLEVSSCMYSVLMQPESYRLKFAGAMTCDPTSDVVQF
jgi:hypothetical protein